MRVVSVTLFAVGLLVSFTAFAADHATNIPFVLRVLAPAYYHAAQARATLEAAKQLHPADAGFREIEQIFVGLLAKENSAEALRGVAVTQFTRGTAMLGFSESRAREVIPVHVQLSNGQTLQWDLSALDEQLATRRDAATFRYGFVAFLLGSLTETVAFAIEFLRPKRDATSST